MRTLCLGDLGIKISLVSTASSLGLSSPAAQDILQVDTPFGVQTQTSTSPVIPIDPSSNSSVSGVIDRQAERVAAVQGVVVIDSGLSLNRHQRPLLVTAISAEKLGRDHCSDLTRTLVELPAVGSMQSVNAGFGIQSIRSSVAAQACFLDTNQVTGSLKSAVWKT